MYSLSDRKEVTATLYTVNDHPDSSSKQPLT
jgi:hypothetical protein